MGAQVLAEGFRVASVRAGQGCPVLDTEQSMAEPCSQDGGTRGKVCVRRGKMVHRW